MSNSNPINLTPQGPPTTVLPLEDASIRESLATALTAPAHQHLAMFGEVAMRYPRSLFAWAHLGDSGRDTLERYAYYRIGYHRGLDTLRQNGWRGSGYVRWDQPSNQGFLRCLHGLQQMAALIGETDEAERCIIFLLQLDPSGVPAAITRD
ncbi:MAG: DUF3151 domain-containing protein [Ilumatobacteraceae bacterium]|nr:DUF3151 domain-containing protein [Ilumatobacteraceae bacterium]